MKKKKKTKNIKKKSLKKDNISFQEKGDMVEISWNRTDEEHEQFLAEAIKKREVLYKELKMKIDETISVFSKFDKLALLANISHIMIGNLEQDSPLTYLEKDSSHLEVICEYAQSLALSSDNIESLIPRAEDSAQLMGKIREIISDFVMYFTLEGANKKLSQNESKIRYDVITNTLIIRGEGYQIHINEVFLELFGLHDEFIKNHYNFNSQDILDTFATVENQVYINNEKVKYLHKELVKWMNSVSIESLIQKYGFETFKEIGLHGIYHLETGMSEYLPHPLECFKIDINNTLHLNVAKTLSLKFGDNAVFLNPPQFKAEPLVDSRIFSQPFILNNEEIYYFMLNLGFRNFFNIGEYLLKSANNNYYQQKYLSKKNNGRDKYVEDKTLQAFSSIFPEVTFYSNVTYTFNENNLNLSCTKSEDGNYELDILGVTDKFTLLIEVKAGSISQKAKRGAINGLKENLGDILGYASCQSFRAEQYILSNPNPSFIYNHHNIDVNPANKIYKINISFAHLWGLSTQLQVLKNLGVIENKVDFSWCISLFDLLIFRDLMKDIDLLKYLDWRLPLYNEENLNYFDEISLLGYYFSRKSRELPKILKRGKVLNISTDFSTQINNYFNNKFIGKTLPKPFKV